MERECIGSSSKNSVPVVKTEIVEDSGFAKGPGTPWLLSNKLDPLASSGDTVKSAADIFDANHTQQPGSIQKLLDAMKNQQFLGGIPFTLLPSTASVVGTRKQWSDSKAAAPAQLTIFYAGKVNVFDDISPEKAQAIILLAGNGCVSSNMTQPRFTVDTPPNKLAAADGALGNQSMNAPPGSALSSPMSVSSHPIDQSRSTPNAKNEDIEVSNSPGFSANLVSKMEPQKVVTSLGSIAATAIMSSAVPQARKASLARFFEKRKERAMNSAPYNICKKAASGATSEASGFGFSPACEAPGSISLSSRKETSAKI